MKTALVTATLLALSLGAAVAAPSDATSPRALYTCAAHGLSRVALHEGAAACCTGAFACPQLLSNTGLVKPRHDNRT